MFDDWKHNMRIFSCLLLVFLINGCTCDKIDELPSQENITTIRATLWGNPESGPYSGPSIKEFEISVHDYQKILDLFSCAKLDRNPAKWQVLGYLIIKTISSTEIEIGLFSTSERKGAFEIDGTYYRGSKDAEIVKVLLDCHNTYLNTKNASNQPMQ